MMIEQKHEAEGDNVGRDKIHNISNNSFLQKVTKKTSASLIGRSPVAFFLAILTGYIFRLNVIEEFEFLDSTLNKLRFYRYEPTEIEFFWHEGYWLLCTFIFLSVSAIIVAILLVLVERFSHAIIGKLILRPLLNISAAFDDERNPFKTSNRRNTSFYTSNGRRFRQNDSGARRRKTKEEMLGFWQYPLALLMLIAYFLFYYFNRIVRYSFSLLTFIEDNIYRFFQLFSLYLLSRFIRVFVYIALLWSVLQVYLARLNRENFKALYTLYFVVPCLLLLFFAHSMEKDEEETDEKDKQ